MNGKVLQIPRESRWTQVIGSEGQPVFRHFMVTRLFDETSQITPVPGGLLGTTWPPILEPGALFDLNVGVKKTHPTKRPGETVTRTVQVCRLCKEIRHDHDTWLIHENECPEIKGLAIRTIKRMIQDNNQLMLEIMVMYPIETQAACAELLLTA